MLQAEPRQNPCWQPGLAQTPWGTFLRTGLVPAPAPVPGAEELQDRVGSRMEQEETSQPVSSLTLCLPAVLPTGGTHEKAACRRP